VKPDKALVAASNLLGLDVENPLREFVEEVVDGGDEAPEYVFVGAVGRARVTAKQLTEFRYCDPAIAAATGEVVDHLTPTEWRKARRALLAAKTVEKLGPEGGLTGSTRTWLLAELGVWTRPSVDAPEGRQALENGWPVTMDKRAWFSVEGMMERLEVKRVRASRREVMRGLAALGCRERTVKTYTTEDGRHTSRTLYAVPTDVLAEFTKAP